MLKIGHRGAKGYVAENTLESIKKAIDLGVDGVEVDVHACASGELVVFHDFTVDRVTNGTGCISEMTLSQIKKLKIEDKYSIPTLTEVMDLVGNSLLLNIELKGKNTAKKVGEVVSFYVENNGWKYRDVLVTSFQFDLLSLARKANPMLMLGVLTDTNIDEALAFAKTISAVSINPDVTMLTAKKVEKIQKQNYQVITYTVNDEATIDRMKTYGVDGIISDYPDRL